MVSGQSIGLSLFFGDRCNQMSRATQHFLDLAVAVATAQKAGDVLPALQVWLPPLVLALRFGYMDALELAAPAVFVVFSSHGSQHVEHHGVYCPENGVGESGVIFLFQGEPAGR